MAILAISDTHGFLAEAKAALEATGLLYDKSSKIAVLGDILDRGEEAVEMTEFLLSLKEEGRLILIRGNHEDLFEECLWDMEQGKLFEIISGVSGVHHLHNGTMDTMLQLAGMTVREALESPNEVIRRVKKSRFYRLLLPECVNYYETPRYVLTHGWIPCRPDPRGRWAGYHYDPDWRQATEMEWHRARWQNGMAISRAYGIREPGKTVVCGHYTASYGHAHFEHRGPEYGPEADFSPYYGDGIIAIDGSVANSGSLNCIVLEE